MAMLLMLDCFPWFALLQWLLRPSRLRGGVRFHQLPVKTGWPGPTGNGNTTYFELLSQEASIVPFFRWFHRMFTVLTRQYSASYLARCLLLGQEILPVRDCRTQLISS